MVYELATVVGGVETVTGVVDLSRMGPRGTIEESLDCLARLHGIQDWRRMTFLEFVEAMAEGETMAPPAPNDSDGSVTYIPRAPARMGDGYDPDEQDAFHEARRKDLLGIVHGPRTVRR